jgi:pristinamycin I synthase 3 and 4
MQTAVIQGFRLSPQQQHLWRLWGAEHAAGLVSQCAVDVEGPLERERLRRALERAVARHEILRTTFHLLPGMTLPVQVVGERGGCELRESRLEELAPEAWEAAAESLLEEARATPFDLEDLANGPLLRAELVALGSDRHALLLSLPALAADGASLRILAEEIAAGYAGAAESGEVLQYADAAEILHEWLAAAQADPDSYWRRQNLAAPAAAGRAAAAADGETRVVRAELTGSGLERIESVAQRLGAPVSVLLMAVWHSALWRSSGQERLLVGTVFPGRTAAELETAVGPFARALPIVSELDTRTSLQDLVAALAGRIGEAAEWQDGFPLDGEVPGSGWAFGFDWESLPPPASPSFAIRALDGALDRFDLRLSALHRQGAIRLALRYDLAVLSPREAERLLARCLRLLAAALERPEAPLAEIDVLGGEERRELLVDFNRTGRAFGEEGLAHELFAAQARRSPAATAVISGGLGLTYAELNARANRLAHHLRALGVGPESRVGLCLPRSPEMVEGLLATLKAGGAYVPLDPAYPAERLAFMAADAGLSVLLTTEALRSRVPAEGAKVICLGSAISGSDDGDPATPAAITGPDDLAYVIYTSGSTGRPKGVMVPHRGLANYLRWARESYDVAAGQGAPVHSPLGFDLTVTSLLAPLVSGAAVVLVPEEDGVGALAAALRGAPGFSLVKLTPAHLEVLRQVLPNEELAGSAAALVIGGEALWAETLAVWRQRAPATRLINEYGPTEATVGCCVHEVAAADPAAGPVPIGRPIANTRLYAMGPGRQPVPAGAPGELWIGGDGLARGYLGRPDATAERFVPDPISSEPGARLYRTGDLVRHRADGSLEYLGRLDDQVKVRGFRIEPGEIEAALCELPGVREAVVVARSDRSDRFVQSLIAYVTGDATAAELRRALATRLPDYMMPAAFVILPALPLTPNGKVDRRALPEPREAEAEVAYVAPRTFEEDLLAEIWAGVLGVPQVGIDDPFFSVGGDSIRSIQVLSLAQERGLALTLQDLFQHPTVRSLAARAQAAGPGAGEPAATPFSLLAGEDRRRLPPDVADAYPLAQLQAGMLFHSEYSPESAIYHDFHSFHLRGRYNPELLQAAVDQVVRRHAVLRTSFALAGYEEPLQLVHQEVESPIGFADLRALEPAGQEEAVDAWLQEERLRPFDWRRPPLVRFQVHRRAEDRFQFTLSFHHCVLDGWSAATLLTELFRRYTALLDGSPLPDSPPGASFAEFVALERRDLASPAAREIWTRSLADAPFLRLPRRPASGPAAAAAHARDLSQPVPPEVSEGLHRLARAAAVPFKSALLAAHVRVCSLLAGQPDVVAGVVVNGRPEREGGDEVAGLFLNVLPLRLEAAGGSWADLARAAFEREREAMPFRRFPLAEIQRLHGGRPLFESAFNFLHYHVYQSLGGISGLEVLGRTGYEETNFPLTTHFQLEPATGRLILGHNFREDEIDAADIERIRRYTLRALEAMAAEPTAHHEEVCLLGQEELAQLLGEWSLGDPGEPPAARVEEVFAQRAARTPDAVALASGDEQITYGELDRRSGALAHRLVERGVGPDAAVGLLLPRSLDLIVGMLAALKAGGAYVPLDPAYPRERLDWMARDAGLAAVIDRVGGPLPASGPLPPSPLGLDGLAYVLYTSGSTGTPKGVAVPHRAIVRLVRGAAFARLGTDEVLLHLAPPSFDAATLEVWGALLNGGRLVVAPPGALSLAEIGDLVERHGVTTLWLTAGLFQQMVDHRLEALRPLRRLLAGGDVLSPEHVRRALAGLPGCTLINGYGPTENTTFTCCHAMAGPAQVASPVPIGRPIARTHVYLLDAGLRPVPSGTPGELLAGGDGLARGYHGRPELTAERFVPDPFAAAPGGRLYRTGDLARFRPDGAVEFLGRLDRQVKIRGFRVEPGEIEAVLCGLPGVREAVVVARSDGSDGADRSARSLVAYVVPARGDLGVGELRAFLKERLPEALIPSAFVTLPTLPLTANGKLDRTALPAPEAPREPAALEGFAPPRSPLEELIADNWSDLLERRPIGVHDDFFALGGHSLLATRVISWVRETLRIELPLRTLFENSTLAGFAAEVERALRAGQAVAAGPIERLPRPLPASGVPLSFAQQRLWFLDQMVPGNPFYNIPASLWVTGRLDVAALAAALSEVVRRHEALRTTFRTAGGLPVQVVHPASLQQLPLADLTALPAARREEETRRLAAQEAQRPFDLARGPLVRSGLVRLEEDRHALLLTMHHVVADGWSTGVLVRELVALYAAAAAGRPSPLSELEIQYPDFAVWQRSWLRGEVLAAEIAYWKERLADPPPLNLPTDRPRPPISSFRGGAAVLTLPQKLSGALRALAQRQGATLYMALLAGWKALLCRTTGQEDLLVGAPIANRNRAEIEGLIGFFVNTLALRTGLDDDPGFRELLERVRETTLGAYAHQDLPFEKLVEELHPERDTSRNPLFQVALLLQNFPMPELRLPGLSVRAIGEGSATAKFDLQIFLEETPDALVALVEYSADLFDPATVNRMLLQFQTLAEAAAADPGLRLAQLPLLRGEERQQLLREWNDTAAPDMGSLGLHQLFAAQAQRTPAAPAIACEGRSLTYSELQDAVNRLARRLRALGCGPETRVGVAMERSLELVIGLLGVLEAGAAYVPLDPEYPLDRLAFMLEDAGPAALLTQSGLLPRLPAFNGPVLCLDEEDFGGASAEPFGLFVDDLQAAYMIYTSGSTGRPKGALVHHGAIRNRLVWMQEAYGLGAGDTVLQKTPFSFDVSVWEFFWPLLTGARLVLARPGGHRDPGYLVDLIGRERVTVLHFVPSMLQAFLEEPDLAPCRSLRLVVASGEALPPGLARRCHERLDARLENLYGPTEAAVDVTSWRCRPQTDAPSVPIGRPIANTRIHLLDGSLGPVPAGVPGELYIGGANVGRGYLGRPALTAERFVPDPFAERPGARLYRTGDLARHLPDGAVEFLGRIDHQVKLRGFRIELGEIEAVLASHLAVRECVALVREDQPGDPRLVAYVVESSADAGDEERAGQVSQWQELYDDTYSRAADLLDPTLNLAGWISSYTGQPIPEGEMREWVEATVERILALRPRRVLEIGCGTGLLLFRVAPHCERYVGADFSRAALDFVARHLAGLPAVEQVELSQRTADDFSGLAPGSFDLVVLNSVVQYFPGVDYLVRVLSGAAELLAPGGAIFVGDVRSLPLQKALAASIELAAAPESLPVSELRQRVHRRVLHEEELLIAPAFFQALPGVVAARIEVKRGAHRNELTAFRYDVTLRTGTPVEGGIAPRRLGWGENRLSLSSLRDLLAEEQPDAFGVSGVPNARVRREVAALALLESEEPAAALREALAEVPEGIEPDDLRRLGAELGYEVEISWSGGGEDGSLDALFRRPGIAVQPEPAAAARPWKAYANDPLTARFARTLMPQLRAFAQERLPDYAVPSAFVLLPALPLSPNGKVDRKALPAPERPRVDTAYAGPRDPAEELLAGIWQEILGVERVGIRDNFFDLGGHSLLATQVVSRVRAALHVELSVRHLFESPTVAELAAVLRTTGDGTPAAPPILPVPRDGDLPLSFAQQRLWFLFQLALESPVYNMPFTFRLSGPLQPPALERALASVVARHETLRTTFVERDGVPAQRIAPPSQSSLPVIDLSGLPQALREPAAQDLAAREAQIPFDLTRPPVVRTRLLKLAGDDHVLLFTIHHVSGDGWSVDVLQRELVELYEAAVDGREPRLPALPVQYADFAVWQRSWLQGEALASQLAYWRRQLAGAPALLELATDHPRPPVQTYRGARESRRIAPELARALEALGRREGATPFMTLLAGFTALLHRATGQETIVVGTPIANRHRTEIEGLIGFFANTLALRVDIGGDATFRRLLGRVREAALGAYAHQDLPFERLVDELQPQRDMSHSPLFQALFVHQSAPTQALRVRDLALRPFNAETGVARFDLTLAVSERADGLLCHLDYNADLFEPSTAARLLRLYTNLLAAAKESPDLAVADLPWLDEDERSQVMALARGADRSAEDVPLHRLFERQVERAPGAIAVVSDEGTVTYADLDRRAGAVAGRLRAAGVGLESRVGICMSRSADAIAALLGVLKAGGAYVPLDPESPRDRLAAILADAGAEILLTEERLAPELAGVASRILSVNGLADEALASAEPPPGQAAYVIYTSGSTGVPKGVVATHRSATHFVQGFAATIGLSPLDRLLLFAPLSFDASVLQIFPALASGGGVVLHRSPRELSTDDVLELCERQGITVLDLPAVFWRQWVEDVAARGRTLPPQVRLYLTGGESVPAARLRTWGKLAGRPAAFLSSYGPTEATVTATVFQTTSERAGELGWANVPIGAPLPGTRVYVLDRGARLVPRGVPGELFLGGPGLARGYLGRPELTAAVFVPDPHSGLPGERLYRTGDLARHLPDGQLEFLGRVDHQVKIRGFRLELTEVEAALARHPSVREAVVLLREDSPGDKRLAAYVTPVADGAPLAAGELRAFLAERLPQYMVPASFTVMAALPALPSGKVDRSALPAPEAPETGRDYLAPRTPEERILAEVWAQVLRVERVGVRDNFFALGGDSILSIQIIARANQRGLHLTPKQLFENQTVAELARVARTSPALRAEQGPVSGPVPLTPIQRWFFAEGFADPHHFNHAILLEAVEPLDFNVLARAATALAHHHDALRLRFAHEEDGWRQVNAAEEPVPPLTWIDLSEIPAALEDAAAQLQTGFDLGRGPLTRLAYFDLGPDRNGRLLWIAHHLVVDGVSWRVLLEDLEAAYGALTLPPKTTSFRAWSERLAEHARSGALRDELEHWLEAARTWAPALPIDLPDGANTVGSVDSVSFVLTPEETQALLQEVPAKYRTQINDVLLAALAQALAGWTGATALRVDLEGHGREPLFDDVDLSRTVGWFTTQFPVVVDPGETGEAGHALAAVKEQLRRVPSRGIGYGLLRWLADDPAAERALRAAPPAEISFNYLGQLDGSAVAGGSLFRPAPERPGPLRSPRSHRTHLLEVSGLVAGGCLRMTLEHSANVHRRATVERLAAAYADALRRLAGGSGEAVLTAADFKLAKLNEKNFRKLSALLAEAE